jgi:peptide/nickel transport system permease protein
VSYVEVVRMSPAARRRRILRRRFFRRPLAVVGLVVALAFVTVALFAPLIAPYSYKDTDFNATMAHPSRQHLFGTDALGHDIFSQVVYGARASMEAGVLATLLALAVAVPIGLVAGYYRGWIDPVIARLTDALLAFPFLILAVGLAAILGPSLKNAILALGIGAIPQLIRIARGEALSLREEDYVRAAIANGASDFTILRRHVLPNMMSTIIVQATLLIPILIIGEATLSFLGLGVQPPATSWGVQLRDAQDYIFDAPRLAIYPGVAIVLATLAFNLFGDGLRDILDPRTQR